MSEQLGSSNAFEEEHSSNFHSLLPSNHVLYNGYPCSMCLIDMPELCACHSGIARLVVSAELLFSI